MVLGHLPLEGTDWPGQSIKIEQAFISRVFQNFYKNFISGYNFGIGWFGRTILINNAILFMNGPASSGKILDLDRF